MKLRRSIAAPNGGYVREDAALLGGGSSSLWETAASLTAMLAQAVQRWRHSCLKMSGRRGFRRGIRKAGSSSFRR